MKTPNVYWASYVMLEVAASEAQRVVTRHPHSSMSWNALSAHKIHLLARGNGDAWESSLADAVRSKVDWLKEAWEAAVEDIDEDDEYGIAPWTKEPHAYDRCTSGIDLLVSCDTLLTLKQREAIEVIIWGFIIESVLRDILQLIKEADLAVSFDHFMPAFNASTIRVSLEVGFNTIMRRAKTLSGVLSMTTAESILTNEAGYKYKFD